MKLLKIFLVFIFLVGCKTQYTKRKPVIVTGKKTVHYIKKKNQTTASSSANTISETTEELEATSAVKVTPEVIRKYIEDYKDISMVEMQRYNIPASITLAQGILESGAGQGRLARVARNHFGIKCHLGWEGDSVTHDDDEKGECFRKYQRAEDSFEDHSLFLVNRPRYANLFNLKPDDFRGWAHGLKKAGYATDPKYANKLIMLISKYELFKYDKQVLDIANQPIKTETPEIISPTIEDVAKKEQEDPTQNSTEYYVVQSGDTLYSIARKFSVSVDELIRINNIQGSNIQIGEIIKIKEI